MMELMPSVLMAAFVLAFISASCNIKATFVECLSIHPSFTSRRLSHHPKVPLAPPPIRSLSVVQYERIARNTNSYYPNICARIVVQPLFDTNGGGDGDANINGPPLSSQERLISSDDAMSSSLTSVNIDFERDENKTTVKRTEDVIYRIAASSDGKLERRFCRSPLLPKLHAIYHASTHFRKNKLQQSLPTIQDMDDDDNDSNTSNDMDRPNIKDGIRIVNDSITENSDKQQDPNQVIATLRKALEDAGFCLINKRDLELCKALNAGYLLRLAILPDVKGLDDCIEREFYPDLSPPPILSSSSSNESPPQKKKGDEYNAILKNSITASLSSKNDQKPLSKLLPSPRSQLPSLPSNSLFGGKILVFRRGYTSEITEGLLLGQKLDYLQSSLVQRSFSNLALQVGNLEKQITDNALVRITQIRQSIQNATVNIVKNLPSQVRPVVEDFVGNVAGGEVTSRDEDTQSTTDGNIDIGRTRRKIKFTRYGGSLVQFASSDAMDSILSPFMVYEVPQGAGTMMESDTNPNTMFDTVSVDELTFDSKQANGGDDGDMDPMNRVAESDMNIGQEENDNRDNVSDDSSDRATTDSQLPPSIRLLKRVSISDLVDFFSEGGRRRLIKSFTSKSNLVEPAFEEVVVIWRPLPMKRPKQLQLPHSMYKIAKMLELEDRLPPKPTPEPESKPEPLQLRTFSQVPMANLLAILPKTKLLFQPADAILFDLVNVVSLSVILASQKLDSAYLDILAFGSISIWIVRTFVKYSNKQARYDLLVNKFLTLRMEHRNQGAIEYVSNEAAEQRAMRASLLHEWLILQQERQPQSGSGQRLSKYQILMHGSIGLDQVMQQTVNTTNENVQQCGHVYADIDISAALDDLVELHLIRFDKDDLLVEVKDYRIAEESLESTWINLFQKQTQLPIV